MAGLLISTDNIYTKTTISRFQNVELNNTLPQELRIVKLLSKVV